MSREPSPREKRHRAKLTRTKPYDLERLEKALRLFGKSKSPLARRSLTYSNLGTYLRSSYNLRVRQSRGADTMDIEIPDADNSDANYQPGKKPSVKKKMPKQIQPPDSPQKCIVKLRVSSVKGWELLHRLVHIDAFADFMDSDDDNTELAQNDDKFQQQQPSEAADQKIRTAFAHPIDCELGNRCGIPCQFCEDFTFGMFGLGQKEVKVIDHGNFFEEIEGGHRRDGHEQTRICNICALVRLRIMNCAGHSISPIPNIDPRTFNFGKAFKSLNVFKRDGSGEGRREKINPWCSLCVNPAFFRCATIHLVDIFAMDLDLASPEAQGCGLLLCEDCRLLMDAHRNDITRVIAAIPGSESVRADVEFLVANSNLSRYFNE